MVQILADPAVSHHGNATTPADSRDGLRSPNAETKQGDGRVMSREEHAQRAKELSLKRGMKRAPRRGWSMTDYQGNTDGYHPPNTASASSSYFDRQATIPEHTALPPSAHPSPAPSTPSTTTTTSTEQLQKQRELANLLPTQLAQRPKLPPPRRSYSVTDYEPAPPNQPKPSTRLTLLDLPSELHYLFCDYLDPIDSVCFGLAHRNLYAMHRRKYGKVPLSSRYSGPNTMEWAWRGAGPLVRSSTSASTEAATSTTDGGNQLVSMRTRGQVYCRKCGISRCELHRHLKDWMGEDMEYCEIRETYGKTPSAEARPFCFMSSPKNPHRCGRHGGKKA